MRNFLRGAATVVLVIIAGCARLAAESESLVGAWMLVEPSGYAAECADLIELHSDGRYLIFNDCSGEARYPLVQSGMWQLNWKAGTLRFTERVFTTTYEPWGDAAELEVRLERLSDSRILLTFGEEVPEHYTRSDQPLLDD